MKLCPYKFGYYEFEGGQDCIGTECGMHKLCGANDTLAAGNDVSAASVDANDSHAKLEEDWTEFYTTHERECLYQSDVGQFVFDLLDRQEAITERELCKQCSWPTLAAMPDKEAYDRIAELQAKVDELTTENAKLSSDELHLRQALASAEYDNATLREKLGRMLDCSHEIERIGQI